MSSTGDRLTLMGRTLDPSPHVEEILEQQPAAPDEELQFERRTRAVLFSDIVGSTSYFEQRGDDAGMAMVERHNQLLFPEVHSHNGSIVKTIGDAIMAAYPTALEAVRSAVAMQKRLKEHNARQKSADRISVRIGINFGQVIHREKDLFGDVVNAAARVEALGAGGMVLISAAARGELPEDFELACRSFDAVRVKGKLEPIEVFEVRWDPDAPATPPGAPPLPNPGDVLGDRFEIVSMLGAGGMGQVFEARDRALDERVALKFILANLAREPETIARFKQEVKLARSVTHRNICRIHEFLQTERHTFLSMELLRGTTLTDLIAEKAPLAPVRAVEIAAGICSGLAEAHERRITHRDLKPSNVMIEDKTGRVVIMDFGIAQLASAQRSAEAGEMIGTPAYMSPEQVKGGQVGPASDVYAVGAILYELLCGRAPHQAPTPVAVAVKQLTEEPERPRTLNPNVPGSLEEIVLKCLAKDPAQRYPDAGVLSQALVPEQPDTLRLPFARRGRTAWIASALVLVILLLGAIILWPSGQPPAPAGPVRHLVSSKAVEHSARWSPDGRFVAFLRDADAWVTTYPTVKLIRTTTGAGALMPIEPADLSWSRDGNQLFFPATGGAGVSLFQVPAFGGSPVSLIPGATGADISPDGESIAFTERISSGCFGIAISRPDGSDKQSLLAGDASVSYLRPRWSPDGDRLALVLHYTGFDSTRDIGVYDLKSRKLETLTRDGKIERAFNTDPTWSPDGEWILYASKRTGTMSLWTVPSRGGESVPFTQGATEDQRGPSVSPDGVVLFNTAGRTLDVSILRPDQRKPVPLTQDVWLDRFPAFSPDGERVAFRSQRNSDDPSQRLIVIHDLNEDGEEDLPGPAGLRDFAWCGKESLAYASTVGKDRRLGLVQLESGQSKILADKFHRLWAPSADPECRRVVFSAQKKQSDPRRLWLADIGQGTVRQLDKHPGRQTYPAFSPNGARIAYRWAPSDDKLAEAELRVFSLKSGKYRTVTRHPSFRGSLRCIRWSGDGKTLYYMEATGLGGTLWKIPLYGDAPEPVADLKDIHTFDYDVSPKNESIVYPREILSGDLFVLEDVQW